MCITQGKLPLSRANTSVSDDGSQACLWAQCSRMCQVFSYWTFFCFLTCPMGPSLHVYTTSLLQSCIFKEEIRQYLALLCSQTSGFLDVINHSWLTQLTWKGKYVPHSVSIATHHFVWWIYQKTPIKIYISKSMYIVKQLSVTWNTLQHNYNKYGRYYVHASTADFLTNT